MALGNGSHYEPYTTYLKSQTYGQLPSHFTDTGKNLLNQLIGARARSGLQFLPPKNLVSVDWGCFDPKAPLDHQQAALLVVQRGWDEVLIPVYDMISHRNGKHWYNTREVYSVHHPQEPVQVVATRNVAKGEELYTSYDGCLDCGGRSTGYGTSEILRDYGFVEMYPQRWNFKEQGVSFTLDYKYDKTTGKPVKGDKELQLKWSRKPATVKVQFFEQQVKRLETFKEQHKLDDLNAKPEEMPQHEWDTLRQYHGALMTTMQTLIAKIEQDGNDGREIDYDDDDDNEEEEEEDQSAEDVAAMNVNHGARQVDWVRTNGGFVTDKIEIRKLTHVDNSHSYGVFAVQDIDESDLLLTIPRSCLLQTFEDDSCDTVDLLAREMRKGDKSFWEPYISYLKTQPYGQLPSLWSDAGKEALSYITWQLFETEEEEEEWFQVLPPQGLDDSKFVGCRNLEDEKTPFWDKLAAMLVHQRGWDEVMIPVYDLMSHRNDGFDQQHKNTREVHSVHNADLPVQVEASRKIKAGEEIYTSYDSCLDCGARKHGYGTPEIFRDYGFVEVYPQRFTVGPTPNKRISFMLDSRDGELVISWEDGITPDDDVLAWIEQQKQRLAALGSRRFSPDVRRPRSIPKHEWDTILLFQKTMLTALEEASQAITREDECLKDPAKASSCLVSNARYSELDEMFDDEGYNRYTCDVDWSFPKHNEIDEIQSQYQHITFIQNPEDLDVCFSLESTWQQCGSYRPHYHEMVVHYAARYLPEIKRVLWVGGGDSMLLHEILKYPALEFAVGLELDQQVTRKAYQHFGAQPHWNHPKVQWWYGDGAKSLLMLPKEYFGTFDLVLVDLSETVMSALVTDGLDIMAAMTLLLKPDGIFVKNEIYLEKLNKIFKHSIQLHFYDVPVLCSQSLIFGSDAIDFMNVEMTDHGIDDQNLFITPLKDYDYRYHEIHDYVMNPYPEKYCKNEIKSEEDFVVQDRSPGILMILEAEKAAASLLTSTEQLTNAIVTALESEGLSVVSTIGDSSTHPIVVMKEGYVVARAWPKKSYVAYDIHLWSSFPKLHDIKTALLSAVQSTDSSVFRIVAGGMFNVDTWKVDDKSRGPSFDVCEGTDSAPTRTTPMPTSVVDTVLAESLGLLPATGAVAAIACASEESCWDRIDLLNKHPSIQKVIPLSCPMLGAGADTSQEKFTCESTVYTALQRGTEQAENVVGLLVLDLTAPFSMGQVLHKIASREKNKEALLSDQLLVLAPMVDEGELWRRVFVDRFREIYRIDPVFRSEVLFNTTDSTMEMGSLLAGDAHYFEHLKTVNTKIANRSPGVVFDLRNIEGAIFPVVEDPQPPVFALPGDYDQQGPYEQWLSQQPMGHQVVEQFEVNDEFKPSNVAKSIKTILGGTLRASNIQTTEDVQEFAELGDGSVLVAVWAGGSAIVTWDGRTHVGINLFTENETFEFAKNFVDTFLNRTTWLSVTLRDEMPRGYGRVVNFAKDMPTDDAGQRFDPHWAVNVVKES